MLRVVAGIYVERVRGIFSGLQDKVDGFFYKCEFINNCAKTTGQCWHGGNSYCGEYRKKLS